MKYYNLARFLDSSLEGFPSTTKIEVSTVVSNKLAQDWLLSECGKSQCRFLQFAIDVSVDTTSCMYILIYIYIYVRRKN